MRRRLPRLVAALLRWVGVTATPPAAAAPPERRAAEPGVVALPFGSFACMAGRGRCTACERAGVPCRMAYIEGHVIRLSARRDPLGPEWLGLEWWS